MSRDIPLFDFVEEPAPKKISPRKKSKREKAAMVSEELIRSVFDHWVAACCSPRGPKPIYSLERRITIGAAISDYGVDVCKQAITGCSLSNWHMGQNPGGKRYNSLDLIFRNADKIEQFLAMAVAEETKGGFLD